MTTDPKTECAKYGHCWHVAADQHTVSSLGDHRDDVCCWCGKPRCVRMYSRGERPGEPWKHGPHGTELNIGWEAP